ncbi:DeoR/GlpR family DNA-binding transcription regulator [Litoreibacter halocynthiae]|uniref:DeoR/GlpR family DNA-binding transcription regulator n=1 Tax=Litoreibacter halocynthiae TaxID=1242689 RepID=UPI0024903365|nr:DeoR/GlpR family DNA-binding transcription regulator [Litoreibacter halocynthiae]
MSKHEQEILSLVNLRGTITVVELAQTLDVSDQTIRRIVKPMEERGVVRKVHGALISTQEVMDPPFLARMNKNRAAKVAIANCVADLVQDGSSLAIDTGSTSGYVAQALRRRKNLTIVTNSAYIASTLSMVEGNRVFMAGTQLRNHDGAAFDRAAFDVVASLTVEHAILSASSVHPTRGFLAFDQCEIDIARAMIDISARTVMAVDATKFSASGSLPSLRMPELRADDVVVVDQSPGAAFSDLIDPKQLVVAASQ